MKKVKKYAVGVCTPPQGGEEARARMKYLGLLQDYEELHKETEARKKRLQKAKQRKHRLIAELKFLRKKYETLSKNPNQRSSYKLKKQTQNFLILSQSGPKQEPSSKNEVYVVREAGAPSTSAVLDLNQAFLPNGDEMEEFQVEQEPLKMEKSKRCSMEGDAVANELKLSICRDVGTSSNRISKRKVSWYDQLALKV